MTDETNREAAEEPNVEPEVRANPETGSEDRGGHEAEPGVQTESAGLTPEEIEDLKAFKQQLSEANITDPKALYADYTRKSQRAKQADELEAWKSQVEIALRQQAQVQNDPVAAARQRWQESRWTENEEAALDEYLAAREQRIIQRSVADSIHGIELKRAIAETSRIGGLDDPMKIAQMDATLTPTDKITAYQLLEAYRTGNLPERLGAIDNERKAEEIRRKRLDDLAGDGSPGRIPGADRNPKNTIDPGEFYAMAPSARKRIYGSDKLEDLIRR